MAEKLFLVKLADRFNTTRNISMASSYDYELHK